MSGAFDGGTAWNATSTSNVFSDNIRIVCIAIACYEFVLTVPAEWRTYKLARRRSRISTPAMLFFLIRYLSVLLFVIGNYLYWAGGGFSDSLCRKFWFIPVIVKCLQAMVVQVILGWRTYKISGGNRKVLYSLAILHALIVTVQWFTSFFDRRMIRPWGSCSSGNTKYDVGWGFYFSSSIWDITTLAISLWYLLRIKTSSPLVSKLTRTMLVDGLMYFVAMTAVNVANMVVFLTADYPSRSGSVVVAYTAAWLFSQRILINIQDSVTERRAAATFPTRTVTVAMGDTSAEALSQEVSSRLRSAQLQTGLMSRSYCQRLEGTLHDSSGGVLDSFITLEIKSQNLSNERTGEGTSGGGCVHPAGDADSPGRNPDHEKGYKPSEGPLMTTRRF